MSKKLGKVGKLGKCPDCGTPLVEVELNNIFHRFEQEGIHAHTDYVCAMRLAERLVETSKRKGK